MKHRTKMEIDRDRWVVIEQLKFDGPSTSTSIISRTCSPEEYAKSKKGRQRIHITLASLENSGIAILDRHTGLWHLNVEAADAWLSLYASTKSRFQSDSTPSPIHEAKAEVVEAVAEVVGTAESREPAGIEKPEVDHRFAEKDKALDVEEESNDKLATITYGGISIGIKGQMVDATAMWRACGSPENLRPSDWLSQDRTIAYIEVLREKLNATQDGIWKSAKGRYGGTWMHRLLAVELARALDPKVAVAINEFYLEGYDNGGVPPTQAITREDRLLSLLEKQLAQADEKARLERERQDILLAELKANREAFTEAISKLQPSASRTREPLSDVEKGEPFAQAWVFARRIDNGKYCWGAFLDNPYENESKVTKHGVEDTSTSALKAAKAHIKTRVPACQHSILKIHSDMPQRTIDTYAKALGYKLWAE